VGATILRAPLIRRHDILFSMPRLLHLPKPHLRGEDPNDHTAGISARCRRCGLGSQTGNLRSVPKWDLDDLFRLRARFDRCIVEKLGDADGRRRSAATGRHPRAWVVERFGVSLPPRGP